MTASAPSFEFGIDTFGDVTRDAAGASRSQAQVLRDVVEEAVIAEQAGIDCFGVGEHHRPDFSISAPEVILAAIAGRTSRMWLGSAVTVLSTDDPVRVYQRFSTLNAVSNGRAEVILGRGSFTESYPLFGYDMALYEQLFEEKLELFASLLKGGPVTWSGSTRSPIENQIVYPPIETGSLRTWVGVGGSPESVIRAARYGLPLTLAIIGGNPQRFRPYVDLYHEALGKFGFKPQPIAVHSPGHVADTDQAAKDQLWPHYEAMMNRIGRERGWPPTSRAHFEQEAGPNGALCVGSAETVAAKIIKTVRALGLARFDLKYANGTMPHDLLKVSIELIGTKVAPRVREALEHAETR
ncbi:MAG TPA: LLM class flavin-dependent oxidoreductase [Vicinamibacterales bacterium]|nr:LLM class flavin-dependent oxidoreductase [Vicinamibacterales bacterium]